MKKTILFLVFFFLPIWQVLAILEVKTNLAPGNYNFPIEVYLMANDKDAKIFYYTDGIGRMDTILEYKKPLVLKEDTSLDFFATTKDYEDTPIQSAKYTFTYSNKITLSVEEKKIILKNTDADVQNIWYWKIESDTLNYEITPNTFLEKNQIFTLDYTPKELEKIRLYSPDKKEKKSQVYKTPPKEEIEKDKIKVVEEVKIENISPILWEETITETWWEISLWEESWGIIEDENASWSIQIPENVDFQLTENITASVQDKKTNNWVFFFLSYLLWVAFMSIISYNIYISQRKNNSLKKIFHKIKK